MKQTILIILIFWSLNGISQNSRMDTISSYSNQTRIMESNIIPDSVFKITNLKSLSITGMDCDFIELDDQGNDITKCWMIKEIPLKISTLKNLESLQLNVNAIQEIPKVIGQLEK